MHSHFLNQTLDLAKSAVLKGNHPFGAVLVHQGRVILSSENEVNLKKDVTAHAELLLVQKAQQYSLEVLKECTLYTSTEPCAMCSGAIYWSGIRHVIFGCSNQELGEIAGDTLTISSKEIFDKGADSTEVIGLGYHHFLKIHKDFW